MFSRNNPLAVIERRITALKRGIDDSASRLRREHIEPERILGPLIGRRAALASLWVSVRKEARAWPVYHVISLVGLDSIDSSFSAFVADLQSVHRKLPAAYTQRSNGPLGSVHRETKKLGTAIKKLDEQVRTQRVRVVQRHHGNMQGFVKIRAAVASFDERASRELDGSEVEYFCDWPGVDLDDVVQVGKIAKLILIDRDGNQEYELRCRLAKPGRPLMRSKSVGFPTPQDVEEFSLAWDGPEKIYVAAARPTWRIVWTFKRGSGSWYW